MRPWSRFHLCHNFVYVMRKVFLFMSLGGQDPQTEQQCGRMCPCVSNIKMYDITTETLIDTGLI